MLPTMRPEARVTPSKPTHLIFFLLLACTGLLFSSLSYAADIKFTSLPSNATVSAGNSVTLSASAKGSGTIKYQWYKDGKSIKGATSSKLKLSRVDSGDQGQYQIKASNKTGANWSRKVTVKVSGGSAKTSSNESSSKSTSTKATDSSLLCPPKQTCKGKAILTWSKPSKRTDGLKLRHMEIDAFRIYHLSGAGKVQKVYEVSGTITRLAVKQLPKGTHYFALATVDTSGTESEQTKPLKKVIK